MRYDGQDDRSLAVDGVQRRVSSRLFTLDPQIFMFQFKMSPYLFHILNTKQQKDPEFQSEQGSVLGPFEFHLFYIFSSLAPLFQTIKVPVYTPLYFYNMLFKYIETFFSFRRGISSGL